MGLKNARERVAQAEGDIETVHLQEQKAKELEDQSTAKIAALEPQHRAAASQVEDVEHELIEKRESFDTARQRRELIESEVQLEKTIAELHEAQGSRTKQLENFETYIADAQIHAELVQAVPSFKALLGKLAEAQHVFEQAETEQEQLDERERGIGERRAEIEKKQTERNNQDIEIQTAHDEVEQRNVSIG